MLYKNLHKNWLAGSVRPTGFTLVEIIVTVAILMILLAIIISGFSALNRRQALDKDLLLIKSVLNEARSLTLSSKEASKYGVHVGEFEVVLFKGNSYDSGSPDNSVSSLGGYSQVSATSLAGGGSDIIFERLTGRTSQSGTITLALRSDDTVTRIITVESTGVVNSN